MTFPTIPTVAAGRLAFLNQLNTTATLTGPNLTALTGRAAGDLVIAIAGEYQSNAGADAAYTGWAGGGLTWTEIRDSTGTAVNRLGVAYAWLVTGSETGTVTVTRSGTLVGDASMILLCIPGAHASTAPEATVMATAANATPGAAPAALNPAGWDTEDTLWIGVNGSGMTSATGSWTGNGSAPANYGDYVDTNPTDTSTIGDFDLAVAFRQLNAASETMAGFTVDSSNNRTSALLIAVRPKPAPNAGAVTGAMSWAGSATGTRVSRGAVTGALSWSGSATGDNGEISLPALIGPAETHVEEESHSYCPVVVDTNGNLYTITESTLAANNQPRAMKSTDRGQTWVEMDAANRPGTDTGSIGDLESGWITWETGGFLTFSWQRSYPVWVRFRTSDHATNPDTWQMNTRNQVGTGSGTPQYMSHTAPTDQSYHWVFYGNGTGASYVDVAASTGVEGTPATLDATATGPAAILNETDQTSYVVYKKSGQLHFKTLTSTGTLSGSSTRIDTNGVHAADLPHAKPVFYNTGDEVITCVFANGSGHVKAVDIFNDTPGSEETITTTPVLIDPGDTGNAGAVLTAIVDGTTMHVFWSNASNGDLMHSSRPFGGSWTTPEVLNSNLVTGVYWLYANVLEIGSERFVALRYSDGFDSVGELNEIYYDEYALAVLGEGSASGAVSWVGSATGVRRNVSDWSSVATETTLSDTSSGTASLSLSGSGGGAAVDVGSATLSVTASGAGRAAATASASLSLSGTGVGRAAVVGTADLSVSAANSAVGVGRTGTASLSLSATGTAEAAQTSTASLSLSGSGSAQAAVTGTGSLDLSGVGSQSSTGSASLSLSASGADRLYNTPVRLATFESGDENFRNWFSTTLTTNTTNPHGGSSSLQVTNTAGDPGIRSDLNNVPFAAVTYGETYLLSLWLKQDSGAELMDMVVDLDWTTATFEAGVTTFDKRFQMSYTWQQVLIPFTVTNVNATGVALYIYTWYNKDSNTGVVWRVDDVELYSIGSAGVAGAGLGTGSLSLSGAGSAVAAITGSASLSVSAANSAVGVGRTGTGSVSLSATGVAAAANTSTGSLLLSGSGVAQAVTTGSGSLSLSGAGVHSSVGSASLSLSGAGSGSAALVASADLSLNAVANSAQAASGAGSLSLSGSGTAGHGTTGTAAISLSGAGTVQAAAISTASLSLSGSGAATTPVVGSASVSLSGTGSAGHGVTGTSSLDLSAVGVAEAANTSTGSLLLSGSGVAQAVLTGSASLTLTAAGNAGFATSGSASLSVSGDGTPISTGVGTGLLTLSGTGATQAEAVAAGSLTFSGSGVAGYDTSGTASLSFTGAGAATVDAVASASLDLSGTASTSSAAIATAALNLNATGSAGNSRAGNASIDLSGAGAVTAGTVGTASLELDGTTSTSSSVAAAAFLSLDGTGASRADLISAAALTLSGATTASASASATASLSLSGLLTAEGDQSASGTGSLSLSGAGGASGATVATGSLNLSGTATTSSAASSAASLSLSGSGAGRGAAVASGSLSLSGSGTASYGTTGSASLSLAGSGTSAARLVGAGSLDVSAIGEIEGAPSRSGTASLSLGGSGGAPTAATTGSASMGLSGSAQPQTSVAGSASVSLTMTILPSGHVTGSGSMQLGASGGIGARPSGTASIAISGDGASTASLTALAQLSLNGSSQAGIALEGFAFLDLRAFETPRLVKNATASLTMPLSSAQLTISQANASLNIRQAETHLMMPVGAGSID